MDEINLDDFAIKNDSSPSDIVDRLEIPLHTKNHHQQNSYSEENLLNNLKLAYEFSKRLIRTSLGPFSKDKLIVKGDLQKSILVTNDGRTLMEEMFKLRSLNENREQHPIHTLLYQLSKNQDNTVGDGTTSVVVLCGEMCKLSVELIEKWNLSVDKIMKGFQKTLDYILREWLSVFTKPLREVDPTESSLKATKSCLLSKQVKNICEELSSIAVEAIHATAGKLHFINVDTLIIDNQNLMNQQHIDSSTNVILIESGICLVGKNLASNLNMKFSMRDCRIALFSCPIETPRLKTRHHINITNSKQYQELEAVENSYLEEVISILKNCNVNIIVSQWGFDNRFHDYLVENNLIGIRWVGADELDRIALATGASICPQVAHFTENMLGYAGKFEYQEGDKLMTFTECIEPKVCSILIRSSNEFLAQETARSMNDALMSVRSVYSHLSNKHNVYGGGCFEMQIYSLVMENLEKIEPNDFLTQTIAKHWAKSLLVVPSTFAENSGLSVIETIQTLIDKHQLGEYYYEKLIEEYSKPCSNTCNFLMQIKNMSETQVMENILVKMNVLILATEMVNMILKIDENIMY
ncbi:predicted protein [Naegleria gruberi]|uniref:Predicted protein n=1 Tax=Naegleria gruberi TaxID=5762 RepID=D2V2R6_NAEGR|nr:uncharacterized protein NAEGRDRAFT_30508 [Naegleria gruberi]EFC48942.1 predicted protein [Naegleria gruberi]|eukprot:XP_002681686.1 predicted protein [Naegleria gruberi strain NEG-M]